MVALYCQYYYCQYYYCQYYSARLSPPSLQAPTPSETRKTASALVQPAPSPAASLAKSGGGEALAWQTPDDSPVHGRESCEEALRTAKRVLPHRPPSRPRLGGGTG